MRIGKTEDGVLLSSPLADDAMVSSTEGLQVIMKKLDDVLIMG